MLKQLKFICMNSLKILTYTITHYFLWVSSICILTLHFPCSVKFCSMFLFSIFASRAGTVAKYCDKYVCLCGDLRNHARDLCQLPLLVGSFDPQKPSPK